MGYVLFNRHFLLYEESVLLALFIIEFLLRHYIHPLLVVENFLIWVLTLFKMLIRSLG